MKIFKYIKFQDEAYLILAHIQDLKKKLMSEL